MIAAVDVHYQAESGTAACVLFRHWSDDAPAFESIAQVPKVAPYEPGNFFRRELPCILAVLQAVEQRPRIVIVDGYVWLTDEREPGLGGHLYEALERKAAIIGVAKTKFRNADSALAVTRGTSRVALHVTAAGLSLPEAASNIREMHGPFRIPTLIRRADQLCRGLLSP